MVTETGQEIVHLGSGGSPITCHITKEKLEALQAQIESLKATVACLRKSSESRQTLSQEVELRPMLGSLQDPTDAAERGCCLPLRVTSMFWNVRPKSARCSGRTGNSAATVLRTSASPTMVDTSSVSSASASTTSSLTSHLPCRQNGTNCANDSFVRASEASRRTRRLSTLERRRCLSRALSR
jgi:hypothetical protein